MSPKQTTTTGPLARTVLAFGAVLALALAAATTAPAAGGPIIVAPGGCALECIQKALVTSSATAAKVELGTTVPTKVVVTARRLAGNGLPVAGPPAASASDHAFRTQRTLFLVGLQPATAYLIAVSASDSSGRTSVRSGTFATKPVETAVEPGPGGISASLSCSAKCITKAVPVQIGPTAAVFEFQTNTPARIRLVVSRDAAGADVVSSSESQPTMSWTGGASLLDPGTRYHLLVRATDANGNAEERRFSFRTVERKVQITFWKVKVLSDGDKGSVSGELRFSYWLDRKQIGEEGDYSKRSSGDVIQVRANGTSRPGLTGTLPANGANPTLDIRVYGHECDGPAQMRNCAYESRGAGWYPSGGGDFGDDDTATAGGPFSLSKLLSQHVLPATYGATFPSGHDAYFVFETTQYHVKFRVYAYLDVLYAW
jgi:hypothetical protein